MTELALGMCAGENSGDLLASLLMGGIQAQSPAARFYGIGGPRMVAKGFDARWPAERLAVHGYIEALKRYRELVGIRNQFREQMLAVPPNVFVGIDAPDFNLDLEISLKAAGIPTVHFISPSIWAWRGERIHKIKTAVDHMLCVFPFEAPLYEQAGIPVTYVGHPLAEVIPMQVDVQAARRQLGIASDALVVALLPGSRNAEIRYIAPAFLGAAKLMLKQRPELQFVLPAANPDFAGKVAALAQAIDLPLRITDGQSHQVLAACNSAIVGSGTATLETALFKKPMVIGYRMNWLQYKIMWPKRYKPFVGLPNVLADDFIVPELLQDDCTAAKLAATALKQLDDHAGNERLLARFVEFHHALQRNTAELAAQAVLGVVR
ncbi:lipid-A-disaccharide synthase [Ampullimonas aquatilis]|uniref:lipid-A-disaccharide synthase n=1 Tax=Ampullimonas aquatilis TaxID=1341549 RepID=UPI003C721DA4